MERTASDEPSGKRPCRPQRLPAGPLLFLALLLLALLLYGKTLRYGMVGHDTYPVILTARIESAADVAGTFTEELMDGRYTQGHFYRPALNVSFAVDHALFGLAAWGYHLTDILLLASTSFLLALLLGSLTGGGAAPMAAVAILFLVHPVHLNVLPVPARRGDTLSLAFTLLALLADRRGGRGRRWMTALFTLAAVGSKEIGVVVPLLLALRRLIDPAPGEGKRIASAFRGAILPAAAVLLFAAVRSVVIGGIGGHGALTPGSLAGHALRILPMFQRLTYYPYPVLAPLIGNAAARRLLLALIALASLLPLARKERRDAVLFIWAWMILAWATHGISQSISPWYVIHTTAPFVLLSVLVLDESVRWIAAGRRARRAAGIAAGLLFFALAAVNARNAPLFAFHPEWSDATRRTERFLDRLEETLARTPDGATIDAPDLPFVSPYREGSPIVLVASLADYTVQAWAELTHPERKIRVAFPSPPPRPPEADEVLVVVRVGNAGRNARRR